MGPALRKEGGKARGRAWRAVGAPPHLCCVAFVFATFANASKEIRRFFLEQFECIYIFTRNTSFQWQLQPCSLAVVSLPAGPVFESEVLSGAPKGRSSSVTAGGLSPPCPVRP